MYMCVSAEYSYTLHVAISLTGPTDTVIPKTDRHRVRLDFAVRQRFWSVGPPAVSF